MAKFATGREQSEWQESRKKKIDNEKKEKR